MLMACACAGPDAIHKSRWLVASLRPGTPQLRSFHRNLSYGFGPMLAHVPTISSGARSRWWIRSAAVPDHPKTAGKRVSHSFHRGVESQEKKLSWGLDIFRGFGKITNGSALPKSAAPCRGFTVGSEVIQGTDPIVRRLISTG